MILKPNDFNLELNTTWSFPEHGNWATHNSSYRGNWSPYIPRNIILRYSKPNDVILDQFVGSGTTLIEAKLLNRNAIGIDINQKALEITSTKLDFPFTTITKQILKRATATNLNFIPDESIDLICTHPPYSNAIKYSHNDIDDLSLLDFNDFLYKMSLVAKESYRVLKNTKYCAILIGDLRKNKNVVPLGFNVMNIFLDSGFKLKEIIIKRQHNNKMTDYWIEKSKQMNFLLLSHEYLFVFYK